MDEFLKLVKVSDVSAAMQNALMASLQRNKTYCEAAIYDRRAQFRARWASLLKALGTQYSMPVSDQKHCDNIVKLSHDLTNEFADILHAKRLRIGTAQKSLNLYLKFLWRLNEIAQPPHCPIDRIVLTAACVDGAWTKLDSIATYMEWIDAIRRKIGANKSLSEWEHELWMRMTTMQTQPG